ncbi:unnamed protein product, partial [Prorocentrum cordatum]
YHVVCRRFVASFATAHGRHCLLKHQADPQFPRSHPPWTDLLPLASTPAAMADMMASAPTGLKGKLASLEDFISMQNEELAAQRQEIESLRNDKTNIEDRQIKHALPGAAHGAEEDDGLRRTADTRGCQAPFHAAEG